MRIGSKQILFVFPKTFGLRNSDPILVSKHNINARIIYFPRPSRPIKLSSNEESSNQTRVEPKCILNPVSITQVIYRVNKLPYIRGQGSTNVFALVRRIPQHIPLTESSYRLRSATNRYEPLRTATRALPRSQWLRALFSRWRTVIVDRRHLDGRGLEQVHYALLLFWMNNILFT